MSGSCNSGDISCLLGQVNTDTYNSNVQSNLVSTTGTPTYSTIAESANTILDNYNRDLNVGIFANNVNQEILLKQEKLLELKNQEIDLQLQNLDHLQNTIINKDRYVQQTNDSIKNKNDSIVFLIISIVFAILIMIIVALYGYKYLDEKKMTMLLIILAVIYAIVYIIVYDVFYLRSSFKYIFNNRDEIIAKKLSNWKFGQRFINNMDDVLYGSESSWIQNNCQQPCNSSQTIQEEEGTYANITQDTYIPAAGYFYYDGSSPAEQLYPTPNYNNSSAQGGHYTFTSNGKSVNVTSQIVYPDNVEYNNNNHKYPGTSHIDPKPKINYTMNL